MITKTYAEIQPGDRVSYVREILHESAPLVVRSKHVSPTGLAVLAFTDGSSVACDPSVPIVLQQVNDEGRER